MANLKINGKATFVEEKNKEGKLIKYFVPHCLGTQRVYCNDNTDFVLDTKTPISGTVYDVRLTTDVIVTQKGVLFITCLVAVNK